MEEDDTNTFDSVQWTRDEEPAATQSPPPALKSNGKRRQSSSHSQQHNQGLPSDPNADQQDLAGIGKSGYLDCSVSSPQKENDGTKDAYVSYLITTNSDFKTFTHPTTKTRRRFTDFLYLYKYLFRAYTHVAVPPLPDKHTLSYVRGDRYSPDFTHRRASSLHRFLRRIAAHPVLRRNATFLMFLESPDWNATMRGRGRTGSGSVSDGGVSSPTTGPSDRPSAGNASGTTPSVGGSVATSSGSAFESLQDWSMNLFSRPHRPDRRFVEVKEKCDKLDEDLSHVEKIALRVARREGDLEGDYTDLATQFRKLVAMEPGVASELTAFAACVDEEGSMLKTLRESTEREYLGSLRDMSAYVGSLKQLLRTREQKQLDFEALTDYLAKSASDRDALAGQHGTPSLTSAPSSFLRQKVEDMRGVDHESSRRNRLRSKEMEIERLTREVEESKKTSEAFDDQVVGECGEFERIKAGEMREVMGGFCDAQCGFWGGSVRVWEGFLKGLEEEEDAKVKEEQGSREGVEA